MVTRISEEPKIKHIKQTFTFDRKHVKLKHMSKKYSNTTADFLEWNEAMNLVRRLYEEDKTVLSLFIACSCFFGLRSGDTLSLRWEDILDKEEFQLVEKKTQKNRDIKINQQLKRHINQCYQKIKPINLHVPIFIS